MTPAWTIQPNVCIAENTGDQCQIILNINTQNIPVGVHCLVLGGRRLTCAEQGRFPDNIKIVLKQNTLLELKNRQNDTILSQALSIKYQQRPPTRRRIRNPWSIF
jgi:hypothetical protein